MFEQDNKKLSDFVGSGAGSSLATLERSEVSSRQATSLLRWHGLFLWMRKFRPPDIAPVKMSAFWLFGRGGDREVEAQAGSWEEDGRAIQLFA